MKKKISVVFIILITVALFAQETSQFRFTQTVRITKDANNTQINYAEGYVAGDCESLNKYNCPFGYFRTYCNDSLPAGSHNAGAGQRVAHVKCRFVKVWRSEGDHIYY